MPNSKPWLKMWAEWVADPKMDKLTLAEQGAWWRLVTLAHQCGAGGALVIGQMPLTLDEIMSTLKIAEGADQDSFKSMVGKMTQWGGLDYRNGALFVVHYKDRQALAASDTKEAMRQRQRDHRARLKADQDRHGNDVTAADTTPPLPVPPSLPEEGDIEERRGECHGEKLVTPPGPFQPQKHDLSREKRDVLSQAKRDNSVTPRDISPASHAESVTAELAKLYEEFIGVLNPQDVERIKEFAGRFRGPVDWLRKGFLAAGNKRRWPYVQAILERYDEEGGPDVKSGRGTQGRRSAANRGDDQTDESATGDRFGGFHAIESGPDAPED
jgi:hypothetical protein